jgi:hypothetical protein
VPQYNTLNRNIQGDNMNNKEVEEVKRIGYYRAKHLSIFSLLNVGNRDAAELIACMEFVDKEYSQKVNVVQFSEIFCPKWKSCFQALWKKYVVLFNVSRKVDFGIVASYIKAKNAAADTFDFSATYVELISFLLFVVSIDKKSSFAFLFWIYFTLNEERPSKTNLVEMLELMWGPNNDKESKKHRTMIKQSVKYMDIDDFDQKKFCIYDWKTARGYTTPFHHFQREILSNIGSKGLWGRMNIAMRHIIDDPNLIAVRMGEKKKPIGRMKSCRNIGDRKDAWFELCDFVEAFLRYHEMADVLVVEPNGLMEKAYVATSTAVRTSYVHVRKLIQHATRKPVAPEALTFNDDLLDDQSLTKLHKHALKMAPEKLFMKAEKKKDMAYDEMEKTKTELSYKVEYDPNVKPMPVLQHADSMGSVESYDDEEGDGEEEGEVEEEEEEEEED